MARDLYKEIIPQEKWQLSVKVGHDVGTPQTVDYLFHLYLEADRKGWGAELSPFEAELKEVLFGSKGRNRVIWDYFFENTVADSDADSHIRGELIRFGARHSQRPLSEVDLSAELVRDYVLENNLPNGTGRQLARKFGVAYLVE